MGPPEPSAPLPPACNEGRHIVNMLHQALRDEHHAVVHALLRALGHHVGNLHHTQAAAEERGRCWACEWLEQWQGGGCCCGKQLHWGERASGALPLQSVELAGWQVGGRQQASSPGG